MPDLETQSAGPRVTARMMRACHAAYKLWNQDPGATRRNMTRRKGARASAKATMVTALLLASSGMAMADVPQSVPNSRASHNCVATTSGVLYFRENGVRLGQDVRKFAPHGGQRDYVQDALQKPC
jgi:hypothetical protein